MGHARAAGKYVFRRDKRENSVIVLDRMFWPWAWKQVFSDMPGVYVHAVRMDQFLRAPSTHTITRKWVDGGRLREQDHEAIAKGAIVTFGAELVEPEPDDVVATEPQSTPTVEQITTALTRMGSAIGVSPFGRKFGYGRFIPESVGTVSA